MALDGRKTAHLKTPRRPNSDFRLTSGEGPLPKQWAHYRGLYRSRGSVIFSYTVGDTDILDMPFAVNGAEPEFGRILGIAKHDRELLVRICSTDGMRAIPQLTTDAAVALAPERGGNALAVRLLRAGAAKLRIENGAVVMAIPPSGSASEVTVHLVAVPSGKLDAAMHDNRQFEPTPPLDELIKAAPRSGTK